MTNKSALVGRHPNKKFSEVFPITLNH